MKLKCPKDPEHKEFVLAVKVSETWFLNEDGDCEDAREDQTRATESRLSKARCQACDAAVIIDYR